MDSHEPDARDDAADPAASQRADNRDSLLLVADLWVAGSRTPVSVRVRNLSAGGLMAVYPEPVDIGTPVTMMLRGIGRVAGQIAWVAEGRVGVAFTQEIDPLRARKPVGGGRSGAGWPPR